jgi:hypothetical protein
MVQTVTTTYVRHRLQALQRAAVQQAGGREVDARGDELFASFERPASALDAAVAIQRGVCGHAFGGAGSSCGSGSASIQAGRLSPRRATSASLSTPSHDSAHRPTVDRS